MCGIAGVISASAVPPNIPLLAALDAHLSHRGPDDHGWLFFDRGSPKRTRGLNEAVPARVTFLHRRLSILDLSADGWQPMCTPDGRYHIVYNGEVYNYKELRSELVQLGHTFRTATDTEVVLAAWAAWGKGALNRFTGMFAFALLDTVAETVALARDFFGIKPLYFARLPGAFAFASEIPALLQVPDIDRHINSQALYRYLRFGLTDDGSDSLLGGVESVRPGCLLEVSLSDGVIRERTTRYWSLTAAPAIDISAAEAASRLREMFLQSVSLHLRSDVPVGTALSGGMDSSAILTTRRLIAPDQETHAFSYIADQESISEEKWIHLAGAAARANVHVVKISPAEFADDLDRLVRVQGEPFGSTSVYASYRVYQSAREAGMKVMLDGQGADETLAGYRLYLGARLLTLLRQRKLYQAIRFTRHARQLPDGKSGLMNVLNFALAPRLQLLLRRPTDYSAAPRWLSRDWLAAQHVVAYTRHNSSRDALKAALQQDITSGMVPHLLRFADRNAMAWSIENRVPFLTPSLVEFLLSLPEAYLLDDVGTDKSVFRKAMRGIVPDAIIERTDKIGFATPEQAWFRFVQDRIDAEISDARSSGCQIFNWSVLRGNLDHRGFVQRLRPEHGWRILNFLLWRRTFNLQWA